VHRAPHLGQLNVRLPEPDPELEPVEPPPLFSGVVVDDEEVVVFEPPDEELLIFISILTMFSGVSTGLFVVSLLSILII